MIKSKIARLLRKGLFGEDVIREFAPVGLGEALEERVYLRTAGQLIDITRDQWMLGQEPLTFGVWVESSEQKELLDRKEPYTIFFRIGAPDPPGDVTRSVVAMAELNFFDRIDDERGALYLLQIRTSSIRHISALKAHLIHWKFYKKPQFTYEKLKAVATAYSYPRRVRIISFKVGEDYNYIFPMDLLGDIRQSGRYLLGMRHSNKVLTKIMEVKKIVIAEVPAEYKPTIYKLGRNHSANPPSLSELPFGVVHTKQFGFPVPEWAESYKEVTILRTRDIGSHMLLFGEWKEDVVLKPATPRLHHIHFLHFLHQKGRGEKYTIY